MGAEQSKPHHGTTTTTTTPFGYAVRDTIWGASSVTPFSLHIGHDLDTRAPVSVFCYERGNLTAPEEQARISTYLGNAVRKLRTIRHPGLVRFLASHVTEVGIRVVTEPVIPFAQALLRLSPEQVCLGICSLLVWGDGRFGEDASLCSCPAAGCPYATLNGTQAHSHTRTLALTNSHTHTHTRARA